MESLYKDGKEWLYRSPRPAFWRAVTDNDRGCGFAFRSAVWSAADRFVRCSRVEARMDGEEIAIPLAPANNKYTGKETCDRFEIVYTYKTPTVPVTEVTVTYTVERMAESMCRQIIVENRVCRSFRYSECGF